jgi:peptidoglycan hydrolase-like protein with peptidoglycan-binding domain
MHSNVKVYAGSAGLLVSSVICLSPLAVAADTLGVQAQQVVMLEERVDVPRSGNGPKRSVDLISAAASGDAESVRGHLLAGADPDARNVYGSTALHYAALFGHVDVVEVLLKAGADARVRDNGGATAAVLAKAQGSVAVLARLDGGDETFAKETRTPSTGMRRKIDIPPADASAELLDNALVGEVQNALQALGYKVGYVDGVMGSRTKRAIRAYQQSRGLRVHGWVDDTLVKSLRGATTISKTEATLDNGIVVEVQRALQGLGYDTGDVDGVMGSRTQKAIRSYQQVSGLRTHGWVDEALLQSLRASR